MRSVIRSITLAAVLAPAAAVAQTVSATTGTAYNTAALSGFATTGSDLTGLSVLAAFAGGGTSSGSFVNLGGGQYGVVTPDFRLSIGAGDDTFSNPFTLTNTGRLNLTGLTLRGAPANLVFDRTYSPFPGSVGSADGRDFVFTSGALAGSSALYTNAVSVGAIPAVGDLFESIVATFGSGGLGANASLSFIADVDAADVGAVVIPGDPRTVTPEPASLGLLATGLGALAAAVRRRKSRTP